MITSEQLEKIKHKPKPSLQDFALLIITVEQLLRRNDSQALELRNALNQLEILNRRVEWYRMVSVKEVS